MAKPALGRGLGNLLGDTPIATKPEPATANPEAAAAAVSPGVGNLLTAGRNGGANGGQAAAALPAAPEKPAARERDYVPLSVYKPEVPPPARPPEEAPPPELVEVEPVQAPRWTLIGADLLLVALAALLVFKSPAPLKAWEMALCLAAVALGGILACVAVLTKPKR